VSAAASSQNCDDDEQFGKVKPVDDFWLCLAD
jgi:hypothetical protein